MRPIALLSILVSSIALSTSGNASAATWYVNRDNISGAHDGTSWATAFRTIQPAIDAASDDVVFNTATAQADVWVAQGVYDELRESYLGGSGQNMGSVEMKSNVLLYGGFGGTETDLAQRSWSANETILDGSHAIGGEPAEHVVSIYEVDNVRLDGFTVTGGFAREVTGAFSGGGILVLDTESTITIANCEVVGNVADRSGGGLYASHSSVIVEGCTVASNSTSGDGGGIFLENSFLLLDSSFLAGNTAEGGGGLASGEGSPAIIQNTVFAANRATDGPGGGVGVFGGGTTIITNCTFDANEASAGGGLSSLANSTVLLTSSIFSRNTHQAVHEVSDWGTEAKRISLTDCLFFDNPDGDWRHDSLDAGPLTGANAINLTNPLATGNVSGDPLFVDAATMDYHLADGSAALDRGTIANAPPEDIEGNPRPGTDGLADIGAYEATGHYAPGPDSLPPMSNVTDAISFSAIPIINISFAASDGESRVQYVQLFYSRDGAPFVAYPGTFTDTPIAFDATIEGASGRYAFYTVATDNSNNVEAPPAFPDAAAVIVAVFSDRIYVDNTATGNGTGTDWANASTSLVNALAAAKAHLVPELWVAAGTYTEAIDVPPSVKLYGSFDKTETLPEERNLHANHSVIDVSEADDGSPAENAVRMYLSHQSLIDGFVITGASNSDGAGGGILCEGATLGGSAIANCTITGNEAATGGGIAVLDALSVRITNCLVTNNTAVRGGGIAFIDVASVVIRDCTISANYAEVGGGFLVEGPVATTMDGCWVADNVATQRGGGGNFVTSGSPSLIVNSLFVGNENSGGLGGALGIQGPVSIRNCTFDQNGGEDAFVNGPGTVFVNNIFANGSGPALLFAYPYADKVISHCLFFNNAGGFYRDSVLQGSGQAFNSAIEINREVVGAVGNVEGDPLFVNGPAGDYRLSAGSPGIDSGSSIAEPYSDLLGVPRPQGAGVDIGAYEYPGPEWDSDGDGLTNEDEIDIHGTDPSNPDTDGDGLLDGEEVNVHGSDPLNAHSDDDGIPDGAEADAGTDPTDSASSIGDVYVSVFGSDITGSGSSTRPWESIRHAMDMVEGNLENVIRINVAEGIYPETEASGPAGLLLDSFEHLLGGFRVPEEGGSEWTRDVREFATLIGGAAGPPRNGRIITFDGTVDAVVDGFTLSGGRASNSYPTTGGGAAFISADNTNELANCIVSYNRADLGGGIHISAQSAAVIRNCEVVENYATYAGGGIAIDESSPTIIDCTILANDSDMFSGGISMRATGAPIQPIIENCLITKNEAQFDSGGLGIFNLASPIVRNCTILGNRALAGAGVGMASETAGIAPTFIDCVISGNTATGYSGGFAIGELASPIFERCTISSNDGGEFGGGVGMGSTRRTVSAVFTDCVITGNTASDSAGVGIVYSAIATFVNCIVSGNSADFRSGGLGAEEDSSIVLINSTIDGNTAPIGSGMGLGTRSVATVANTIISNNSGIAIYEGDADSDATLVNSLFHGNADGDLHDEGMTTYSGAAELMADVPGATGIVSGDPLFRRGLRGVWSFGQIGEVTTSLSLLFPMFAENELAGKIIRLEFDNGGPRTVQTTVLSNTATTVVVPGNPFGGPLSAESIAGSTFEFMDYHITRDSAAIGAGTAAFGDLFAPAIDIDGEPRPGVDGAFDIGIDEIDLVFPEVVSITRTSEATTSANSITFLVTFDEAITGLDVVSPFTDFRLVSEGIEDAFIQHVAMSAPDACEVTVHTGTGDGTLSIDFLDYDTVIDADGNPMGNVGVGNGDFEDGQRYAIDRSYPEVISMALDSPNPTAASEVTFTGTFSEAVSGVDEDGHDGFADFEVQSTGLLFAAITEVSQDSPTTFTVTAYTGVGDGTLSLRAKGRTGISDLAGNPVLHGRNSEAYTIDRSPPIITLIGPDFVELVVGVDTYTEEGAIATDTIDGEVTVVIGGDPVDDATLGAYEVTYDATDATGNQAAQVTRIVTVVEAGSEGEGEGEGEGPPPPTCGSGSGQGLDSRHSTGDWAFLALVIAAMFTARSRRDKERLPE